MGTTISWARQKRQAACVDPINVLAEDAALLADSTIACQGDETLDDVPRLPPDMGVPQKKQAAVPVSLWAALPPGSGVPDEEGSSVFDDLMKTMAELTGKGVV